MKRDDVYKAIDSERRHQDLKWGTIEGLGGHEVGAWLTILRALLAKADAAYTGNAGDHHALEEIRKIAGVAVACGEQHGFRPRHISEHKGRIREAQQ